MKPKYKITHFTNNHVWPFDEYYHAEATYPDGRVEKSPLYYTKAEAEAWLQGQHTAWLMQRLIEVNTPQPA